MAVACRRFPAGLFLQFFATLLLTVSCLTSGIPVASAIAADPDSSFRYDAPAAAPDRPRGIRLLNPARTCRRSPCRIRSPAHRPERRADCHSSRRRRRRTIDKARRHDRARRPYEIVAPAANPDLTWDPATRNASIGQTVIAYKVEQSELPAVIDRTALCAP